MTKVAPPGTDYEMAVPAAADPSHDRARGPADRLCARGWDPATGQSTAAPPRQTAMNVAITIGSCGMASGPSRPSNGDHVA